VSKTKESKIAGEINNQLTPRQLNHFQAMSVAKRRASFKKYQLHFKSPVLTSRGEMQVKNGYFLFISDGNYTGTGECSFIEGLSIDPLDKYEETLANICKLIENNQPVADSITESFPSMLFGLETALQDLKTGGKKMLFDNGFTKGKTKIPINGLAWMGTKEFIHQQIQTKIEAGFKCIKIKVGAINFEDELSLLRFIRSKFPPEVIEIRLDANGAFVEQDVFKKLEQLSAFAIHSIEQPVKQGQYDLMQRVCAQSTISIALDEELIEHKGLTKNELLNLIKPQYIILKPSLLGGWKASDEWIESASKLNIGWWVTSALESNIGLNAIAQWVFTKTTSMVQGLGTGELYTDNISSPLYMQGGFLGYNPKMEWGNP
jgi:O-succinylbenzoate synthase